MTAGVVNNWANLRVEGVITPDAIDTLSLKVNGTVVTPFEPAGSTTQVQYNNAGALAGSAALTLSNIDTNTATLNLKGTSATAKGGYLSANSSQFNVYGDSGIVSSPNGAQTQIIAGGAYDASGASGGDLNIYTGGGPSVGTGGASGSMEIKCGDLSAASGQGGSIAITAGNCNGTTSGGGSINIKGGQGTSTNGDINLRSYNTVTVKSNDTLRLTVGADGSWGLGAGVSKGTSGQVLTSNGSAEPTWTTISQVRGILTGGVPASASATGVAGTVAWDSGFLYVCVATDTWVRTVLATWA